jgi:hypothetical protein
VNLRTNLRTCANGLFIGVFRWFLKSDLRTNQRTGAQVAFFGGVEF